MAALLLSGCGQLFGPSRSDSKGAEPVEKRDETPSPEPSEEPADPNPNDLNDVTKTESEEASLRLLRLFSEENFSNTVLTAANFSQLPFDDTATLRCGDNFQNLQYQALIAELGGLSDSLDDTQIYRDLELPLFRRENSNPLSKSATEHGVDTAIESARADTAALPTIARADKIARDGDRVIYLSARYGLFFVDISEQSTPSLSCSVLLPGQPKNFYLLNNRLIVLVDSKYGNYQKGIGPRAFGQSQTAAAISFDLKTDGLSYQSHVTLENQRILDSRRFNDTLAIYTRFQEPPQENSSSPSDTGASTSAVSSAVVNSEPEDWRPPANESMLTVIKIRTSGLEKAFEELHTDTEVELLSELTLTSADIGKVRRRSSSPLSFVSASDRFLITGRRVTERRIKALEPRTSTHTSCAKWNPRAYEVKRRYCRPEWSYTPNASYDPEFRCDLGSDFEACMRANETKFKKGEWKKGAVSCQTHSYWQGQCVRSETITREWLAPHYETSERTELVIYRFEGEDFYRLDDPNPETALTGKGAFHISGKALEHKSFQFKDGYLYAVMETRDNNTPATEVSTYRVTSGALVPAGKISDIAPGENLKAVLFDESLVYFVTFREVDPLYAVDISQPGNPVMVGELKVPGYSGQLIADESLLIGIGREEAPETMNRPNNWRPKVSLYDVSSPSLISEIETHIFSTDVSSAWSSAETDDQVYHYAAQSKTLYVPMSVSNWNAREDLCQSSYFYTGRVSISQISTVGMNSSEVTLDSHVDRVIETNPSEALAFGDSLVARLLRSEQGWTAQTLHQNSKTRGIYRVPGSDRIVALQTQEVGGNISNITLNLGTRSDLENNTPLSSVNLPVELVDCFGMPRVRFFGKKVVLIFQSWAYRNGQSFQSNFEYGYDFSGDEIVTLNEEESSSLAKRTFSVCTIDIPFAEVNAQSDLVEHWQSNPGICLPVEPSQVSPWSTFGCNQNGLCAPW